jgi:hypothetical protein
MLILVDRENRTREAPPGIIGPAMFEIGGPRPMKMSTMSTP